MTATVVAPRVGEQGGYPAPAPPGPRLGAGVRADWRNAKSIEHLPDIPNERLLDHIRQEISPTTLPADVELFLSRVAFRSRSMRGDARALLAKYGRNY